MERTRVQTRVHKFQAQEKAQNWIPTQVSSDINCLPSTGMMSSSLKYQPDGINAKEILLRSTCNTQTIHSKPDLFIIQKVKKPPYVF